MSAASEFTEFSRTLPDGREVWLAPLLFGGARLSIASDPLVASDVYDFQDADRACLEWMLWVPEGGEPEGWYRHRPSNRRRPGGDPTKEYVSE